MLSRVLARGKRWDRDHRAVDVRGRAKPSLPAGRARSSPLRRFLSASLHLRVLLDRPRFRRRGRARARRSVRRRGKETADRKPLLCPPFIPTERSILQTVKLNQVRLRHPLTHLFPSCRGLVRMPRDNPSRGDGPGSAGSTPRALPPSRASSTPSFRSFLNIAPPAGLGSQARRKLSSSSAFESARSDCAGMPMAVRRARVVCRRLRVPPAGRRGPSARARDRPKTRRDLFTLVVVVVVSVGSGDASAAPRLSGSFTRLNTNTVSPFS